MGETLIHTITVWAGIGFLFLALTMIAFIDVMRKDFGSSGKKTLWTIVSLIPFIGFMIYLIFGMRQGKKSCGYPSIPFDKQ